MAANPFICPSCSKEFNYKLNLPVAITCPSCNSAYIIEKNLEVINAECKWESLNEISVLRLHSKGNYKGKGFELIGRIRSVNSLAISNEWVMYFGNDKYMWLTESGSTYFVFDTEVIPMTSRDIKSKLPGGKVKIDNKDHTLVEITKQISFNAEGEIPAESFNDDPYFKYELIANDNTGFATICIFDKGQIEAYRGVKVELSELQLSSVNEFSDWL